MQHTLSAFSSSFTQRLSKFHYNFYAILLGSLAMMSFTTEPNSRLASKGFGGSDTTLSAKQMGSLISSSESTAVDFSEVAMNADASAFAAEFIAKQGNAMVDLANDKASLIQVYDEVLPQYGVPKELKYLSFIESRLNPAITSPVGAAGTWQFMPADARYWGLVVNGKRDERRNVAKSTVAAAKYLSKMYNDFGDWLLVLAAYNCGPNRIKRTIKEVGSSDFWVLQDHLPRETRNHVKKYIALHYLLEGKGGETTLSALETAGLQQAVNTLGNVATEAISGRYLGHVVARLLNMPAPDFHKLNPQFDTQVGNGKTYQLRLPQEKMTLWAQVKQQALAESVQQVLAQN